MNDRIIWTRLEAVLRIAYFAVVVSLAITFSGPLPAIAAGNASSGAASTAAGMPSNEGKVLSTLDAPGYTYMELANTEKRFWIAAPTTRVKAGDRVRFEQSLVMKNFNSKTLNRTFDQIIFVNSATVIN
ncbi:MAG TPA: NrfJ-related protein [Nitrosospira sp.]